MGYNARYLLQTLRNIPTEKVLFRLKTALSAGIVEPVGALPEAAKGVRVELSLVPLVAAVDFFRGSAALRLHETSLVTR